MFTTETFKLLIFLCIVHCSCEDIQQKQGINRLNKNLLM